MIVSNLKMKSPFIYESTSFDISQIEYYCDNINHEDYEYFDKRILTKRDGNTSIEKFSEAITSDIWKSKNSNDLEQTKDSLNNILTNVLKCSKKGKVCVVNRGKNSYSIPNKYKIPYSNYSSTIGLIDKLISLNYLSEKRGHFDREIGVGKMSRIWASPNLLKTLNNKWFCTDKNKLIRKKTESGIIYFGNIDSEIKIPYPTNIILKDSDKNYLDYPLTRRVKRWDNFLKIYNQLLTSHLILIPLFEQDLFKVKMVSKNTINLLNKCRHNDIYSLYHTSSSPLLVQNQANLFIYKELRGRLFRVFNRSSFSHGGRFYGADYQQLNSQKRSEILIDFQPVVEVDFSSLHLIMLYNLSGVDYSDDPYLIFGEELRPLMKLVSLISINAKNMIAGIKVFNHELNKNEALKFIYNRKGLNTKKLFESFIEKHPKIMKYLNSDIGIELQYKDSLIAEEILKHFTKKDIPCLCIHDSFIVPQKYKGELMEVMSKVYYKHFGFMPKLK